jgi:hypothetical protein
MGDMLLIDGPADAAQHLILAHGAGQGPRSPFMDSVAHRLAAYGLRVIRFAFPYMVRIEAEGRRRPPDREPVLMDSWRHVLQRVALPPAQVFIGGKSMGGRIASLIADETDVAGLVCLGYPFHPPGHPDRLKGRHLAQLQTPTLICQGERDPFGTRTDVAGYRLSSAIELVWIGDGEHSFKPRKRSGRTHADNLAQATVAVAEFVGRSG